MPDMESYELAIGAPPVMMLSIRLRHEASMPTTPVYYVYILSNGTRRTMYTGATSDLGRRIFQHRDGTGSQFALRYDVFRLVHVQAFEDADAAMLHERRLKKWRRAWKIALIEATNPEWRDLCEDLQL